jgi:hypothetical protein
LEIQVRTKVSKEQKKNNALHAHFEAMRSNPPAAFNPHYSAVKVLLWSKVVDCVHNEPEDDARTRLERAARIEFCYAAELLSQNSVALN